jgi:hypothetical protein
MRILTLGDFPPQRTMTYFVIDKPFIPRHIPPIFSPVEIES